MSHEKETSPHTPETPLAQEEVAGLYDLFAAIANAMGNQEAIEGSPIGAGVDVTPMQHELVIDEEQLKTMGISDYEVIIVKHEDEYFDGVMGEGVRNPESGEMEVVPSFQAPRLTIFFQHMDRGPDDTQISITDTGADDDRFHAELEQGFTFTPLTRENMAPYASALDALKRALIPQHPDA